MAWSLRYTPMARSLARFFSRNPDGSWTCVTSTTFRVPIGRIIVSQGSRFYPGMSSNGFDLARWLEQNVAAKPPPVTDRRRPLRPRS